VGKYLLMAYLPAAEAVEGNSLLVEYMNERFPVTVAAAHRVTAPAPVEGDVLRRQRGVTEDQVGRLLGHHHDRRVDVAIRDVG
jgi:hypothetical protein